MMATLHNLGLFARMGGPFDRVFFILSIEGDSLVPSEITSLLAINPTKFYSKGDETPSGAQYRKTGAWILDSREILLEEKQFETELFLKWLQNLSADISVWEKLHSEYELTVRLIGYTKQMNADFVISPEIMLELTKRKLELRIEPYLSLDEGDEE
jgi:hypothetical protein